MKIEMSGYAYVRADVRTLKDLRDLVSFLDSNKVRDDCDVDWGNQYVYVVVTEGYNASFIECGEHIPPDTAFDVLLETHGHDNNQVPMFDWPTKDRELRKVKGAYHPTAEAYCHDNGHSYGDAEDMCYVCGADADG